MVRFVNSRRCVHPGISTRWLTEPALSIQELPDFRHAAEEAGLPTNLHYLGRGDAPRHRQAETS